MQTQGDTGDTGEVFAYEKRLSDHKCDRNGTTFKMFDDEPGIKQDYEKAE